MEIYRFEHNEVKLKFSGIDCLYCDYDYPLSFALFDWLITQRWDAKKAIRLGLTNANREWKRLTVRNY